jgi:hypothetical protein
LTLEKYYAAGLLVFSWTRLLEYLTIIPSVGPLARVMGKMIQDVISFLIVFSCYLFGASIAFNIVYGQEVYSYRDLSHSVVSLIRLMFGDGNYEELEKVHFSFSHFRIITETPLFNSIVLLLLG